MKTTENALPAPSRGRRGVALILTLGLLFIVLLIAFSFSVSMHTERLAASAYLDGVWARQALFQPLTLAQREVARHTGTYPDWTARKPRGPFEAPQTSLQNIQGLDLLVNSYLPGGARGEALAMIPNMYWYNLFHLGGQFNETNGFRNLVSAYPLYIEEAVCGLLMVNCSGFLDAHIVGRSGIGNRGFGTNAAEIVTDYLPSCDRTIIGAMPGLNVVESFPEMTLRGDADSSNLFYYSHFPVGKFWSTLRSAADDCAYIGGSYFPGNPMWNDVKILNAIDQSGLADPTLRQQVLNALKDYTDTDSVPIDWQQGSQEPVPGFNEFAVSNSYSCTRLDATQYQFTVSVEVSAELYNGHLVPASGVGCRVFIAPLRFEVTKGPPGVNPQSVNVIRDVTVPSQSNLVVRIPFPPQTVAQSFADSNAWAAAAQELIYTLRFNLPRLRAGTPLVDVDRVNTFTWTITNTLPYCPDIGQTVTNGVTWSKQYECLDPRFNWDINNTNYWRPETAHTLGSNNTWAIQFVSNTVNQSDGDFMMYCANGPLTTVGEIGYIVYEPWKTIRISCPPWRAKYNTNALSAFTLYDTNVTKAVRGLINPNTEHADVLDCAFVGMPLDLYPGSTVTNVSRSGATNITGAVLNHVYGNPSVPVFFRNVSDIGGVTNIFGAVATSLGANNEFLREAILRNSAGLLSTRQQLFTFLLVSSFVPAFEDPDPLGDSTNAAAGDWTVPALGGVSVYGRTDVDGARVSERRAVAVFWRDAWTGESFVRFFKMVDTSDFL